MEDVLYWPQVLVNIPKLSNSSNQGQHLQQLPFTTVSFCHMAELTLTFFPPSKGRMCL